MTTIFETARMKLREFTKHDLDTLTTMVADPDQMRFYPRPKTRDEASAWIDRNIHLYREHGFGFWFMESITTADFLGYCGIRPHEELPEIEMGWHTGKSHWDQGLATEAALACRDLAFDRLGLKRLIAVIEGRNLASFRVAEKLGMQVETEITVEGYLHAIYAIDRV